MPRKRRMGLRRRKNESQVSDQKSENSKGKDVAPEEGNWHVRMEGLLGFSPKVLTSLTELTALLHRPCDASSLGAIRILFGVVMMIDTVDERGFAQAERLWGDPTECRFPLFHFLRPLPVQWMCLVYMIMILGEIGIILGAYFKLSCLALTIPYWYIFLLNKTVWNNHSYLFGLLCILMSCSSAHHCWSVDRLIKRDKLKSTVPLWNYTIFRFQFFALYFFAGLKKINSDWLGGYSMASLSEHWVFQPFTIVLSLEQVDHLIVHITGFLLDLTGGFLIYFDYTRPIAFFFLTLFHLMNSRLFQIGMFPYMCLATMPIFCRMDWPKHICKSQKAKVYKFASSLNICRLLKPKGESISKSSNEVPLKNAQESDKVSVTDPIADGNNSTGTSGYDNILKIGWKEKSTSLIILAYMVLQCFLPYSHFVTKGYNNWTNGLYGYSWDMMVHTWEKHRVVVRVVDNTTGEEHFVDPEAWVQTDRWSTHADMLLQYGRCLRDNIQGNKKVLKNISIYIDVWCSLNGRFQQRMFDPRVDLLTAEWSPFQPVVWLMPLLNDLTHWREKMSLLKEEIWTWSNDSDAIFIADFPGLSMENYIMHELRNVSLTVLEGMVALEVSSKRNVTLRSGETTPVPLNSFHKVYTISETPSSFMYSFINHTTGSDTKVLTEKTKTFREMVESDFSRMYENFRKAGELSRKSLFSILHLSSF